MNASGDASDAVPGISVVIVTWNAGDVIGDCLRSVSEAVEPNDEIIVADNASSDGTLGLIKRDFARVDTLETGANLGFAAAANVGMRRARGSRILLLNPDTRLLPGALPLLCGALNANEAAGAAGPRLMDSGGVLHDHSAKRFPTPAYALARQLGARRVLDGLGRGEGLALGLQGDPVPVPCLTGAALLVTRAALERVGFLDETLPMFLEDLDLCARIGSAGLELMYVPQATVLHDAGYSSIRSPRRDLLFQMEIGQAPWMYLRRYRGRRAADAYAAALGLGALLRLMALVPLLLLARLGGPSTVRLSTLTRRAMVLIRWALSSKTRFLARAQASFRASSQ